MPTLEVIQEKLKKLQAQADVLIAKKAQSALNQIRRLMLEHGLTTEDIEEKAKARREAKEDSGLGAVIKRKASNALGSKVPPKFQDPKSGATWTGRGSAPAWIAKAKDRTRFLIQGDAVAAHAASPEIENADTTTTGKPRGYRTGPQPAKYRDRKSGATWSGKGRAPAWLANVRDRTKFLIEEDASPVAEVATKATRKSPVGAKKADAAKKATRKVAAKKITAKKAAATKNEVKKSTPIQSAAATKKVAAKNAGPAAKKKVAKKVTGAGNAAKTETVADDNGSTQAAIEASAV